MIWSRGELIADDVLKISVLDRTFEHGLGLFETLRTWNGHPTLLRPHLERLQRSARDLALPFDPVQMPDARDVLRLKETLEADSDQDVRIRMTLSGGLTMADHTVVQSTLWMTVGPLPSPRSDRGLVISGTFIVDPSDPLARHKTLNYWRKRIAQSRAVEDGADELLSITPCGQICEGTRSNVFLVEGSRLLTPSTEGPLLDGIMRHVVIDHARGLGLEVHEGRVMMDSLRRADEAFLTNSLRGIQPVSRLFDRTLPAPGPLTRMLWEAILPLLESGEIA